MAETVYTGGLSAISAVQQEDRFTPANVESSDVFTLTLTADDGTTAAASFTATAATVANVTAGLAAAWNASTHRLLQNITATDMTTYVKLVADTAGEPFSVASSTTDGGGTNTQTLTKTSQTASVGGSDAGLAGNYYGNALPGNSGDSMTIDGRNGAALAYGKNLSAKTLDSLRILLSNPYNVGLAPSSTNPTAEYLRVSATSMKIGERPGDGSSPSGASFVAIDTGTNQTTATVYDSNQTGVNGLPAVLLKGVHASNVLNLVGNAHVGVAVLNPGETSTFATINQDGAGSRLTIGSGVTLTTLTQTNGFAELRCAATTVTQDGGELKTTGSGAITTLKVGGTADLQSTGTITTLEVMGTGNAILANQDVARTVTTIKLHKGARLNIAASNLTITNPIQFINCRQDECFVTTNKHITAVYATGS